MIANTLLFLAGLQLGIWMIASLYAVIDLRYAWRRHWQTMIVRILATFGLFFVIVWALGSSARPVTYGAIGFAMFHAIASVLVRIAVSWIYDTRRRNIG